MVHQLQIIRDSSSRINNLKLKLRLRHSMASQKIRALLLSVCNIFILCHIFVTASVMTHRNKIRNRLLKPIQKDTNARFRGPFNDQKHKSIYYLVYFHPTVLKTLHYCF